MQHQTENIGDTGEDIAVAEGDFFKIRAVTVRALLQKMLLVAVLSEQQHDIGIDHCQCEACPAVFFMRKAANRAGRRGIGFEEQVQLFD